METNTPADSAATSTTPAGDTAEPISAVSAAINGGAPVPVTLHMIATPPPRHSRALAALRYLFALAYPLAVLASLVFLFARFGPSGWLWLVLMLGIVAAFMAPKPPGAE